MSASNTNTKLFKYQRLDFCMGKKYRSALAIGPEKKILRQLPQTGKRKDLLKDAARRARLPGKRLSKTGNEYWETRKNRSDDTSFWCLGKEE